jgi:hypothetical protein
MWGCARPALHVATGQLGPLGPNLATTILTQLDVRFAPSGCARSRVSDDTYSRLVTDDTYPTTLTEQMPVRVSDGHNGGIGDVGAVFGIDVY